jgi:ribosomal protein S18 acetylase RimI-like enzyme
MRFIWGATEATIDSAASIWADATAARDGDPDPGPLALARPVIEQALSEADETSLVSALDRDGHALGFALTISSRQSVELYYLGVSPDAWGQGVATGLLNELARAAQGATGRGLELWVYTDNERAIAVYERAGWHHDGSIRTHPRSGKAEHHYIRRIEGA